MSNSRLPIDEFIDAVSQDHLSYVLWFITNHNELVNAKGIHGNTPLIVAALNNRLVMVDILLANKADINQQNDNLDTALTTAASFDHKSIVSMLLNAKADIEIKNTFGKNALECAEANNNKRVVRVINEYLEKQQRHAEKLHRFNEKRTAEVTRFFSDNNQLSKDVVNIVTEYLKPRK